MNRGVPKPIPQVRPTKGDAVWLLGQGTAAQADIPRPQGAPQPGSPRPPSPLPSFTPTPHSPSLRSGQPSAGEAGCQGVAGMRGRGQTGLGTKGSDPGEQGCPRGRGQGTEPSGHHGRRWPSAECEPRKAGDTWPRRGALHPLVYSLLH